MPVEADAIELIVAAPEPAKLLPSTPLPVTANDESDAEPVQETVSVPAPAEAKLEHEAVPVAAKASTPLEFNAS